MPKQLNIIERATLARKLQDNQRRIDILESLLNGVPLRTVKFADLAVTTAKIFGLSADKITTGELEVAVDLGDPSSGYIRFDSANSRIIVNDGTTNRILISTTTFRVSLPTINALTNTDPENFSIYADDDNVLIKEFERGSDTVSNQSQITHSLGYIPFYLIMGEVSSGRYRVANSQNIQAGSWLTYCDDDKIYLDAGASASDKYSYFIFYDDFE